MENAYGGTEDRTGAVTRVRDDMVKARAGGREGELTVREEAAGNRDGLRVRVRMNSNYACTPTPSLPL